MADPDTTSIFDLPPDAAAEARLDAEAEADEIAGRVVPHDRGFSRTFRAVVALCGMQHASAEEAEAGAAIHRSFQHLESVYLAFSGAGGPGQLEGGLHGTEIAP